MRKFMKRVHLASGFDCVIEPDTRSRLMFKTDLSILTFAPFFNMRNINSYS